jgi:glycosyltransferase involved in cell wall biosynthesis
MRILVIHQYFLGKNDAGGSRWNQFARYWAAAGHEVTILAGMVHYATGTKAPEYKGRYIVREQEQPGVTVYRCHVSEAYNKNFLGRAWAYLSFTLSSTYAGIVHASRPDVVIATSPPLTVGPTMWLLSVLRRVPAIFEVRDLWPESAVDTGVLTSKPLITLSYKLEALAYKKARWINVLTPAFERALIEKKGVSPDRISMIPNGADLDIMTPGPKDNRVRNELGLKGKFVVSYFGAHGRANRLGQLLNVAEGIQESMPDVRLMLVGDGMEKPGLVKDAKRRGLENVIFVDAVAKDKVCDYINASDVCTAVLMKNDTFKTVYPNKIFDYMSCERPIILAIDGVARELIETAGAGIFVSPEDPDQFSRAILRLRDHPSLAKDMGIAGRTFVEADFSRESLARRYLSRIQAVATMRGQ